MAVWMVREVHSIVLRAVTVPNTLNITNGKEGGVAYPEGCLGCSSTTTEELPET